LSLPALAVQLPGFARSTENVDVGVSLRRACVGRRHEAVSLHSFAGILSDLRTTNCELVFFVGRNALAYLEALLPGFAHSAENVDVGVRLRRACVGRRHETVSFRPTNCFNLCQSKPCFYLSSRAKQPVPAKQGAAIWTAGMSREQSNASWRIVD